MLKRLGFNFEVVPDQDHFDGRFPTVKSPNPENAEALTMAINMAEERRCRCGSRDPSRLRPGRARRFAPAMENEIADGNQIGSLIASVPNEDTLREGVLNRTKRFPWGHHQNLCYNRPAKAIAAHYGLRCVETLTGFKYIGAKLGKYERAIPEQLARIMPIFPKRKRGNFASNILHFTFSAAKKVMAIAEQDFSRDKDGNGAVIMFCEVAAYAKAHRKDNQ